MNGYDNPQWNSKLVNMVLWKHGWVWWRHRFWCSGVTNVWWQGGSVEQIWRGSMLRPDLCVIIWTWLDLDLWWYGLGWTWTCDDMDLVGLGCDDMDLVGLGCDDMDLVGMCCPAHPVCLPTSPNACTAPANTVCAACPACSHWNRAVLLTLC